MQGRAEASRQPSTPRAMSGRILRSPVFAKAAFKGEQTTQYADALLRATIGVTSGTWHTLLGTPRVQHVTVEIPAGYGYMLTSKRTGTQLAMVDAEYVQRAIFKQIPRQDGKLVIAVTRNTAYYTYGDATVCCTWGTHGVDQSTGNSFVLASYLGATPPLVQERDVQPLTEQLAEWVNDPLHDPLFHLAFQKPLPAGENVVPAWKWPELPGGQEHGCGGDSPATRYTLANPLHTNIRSALPPVRQRSYRREAQRGMWPTWLSCAGTQPWRDRTAFLMRPSCTRQPLLARQTIRQCQERYRNRLPIGGRGRTVNGNQKRASTDRVLDGERTRRNDTPAARCVAAVGRDHRGVCRRESSGGRGHNETACAAGPRSGADERRHRVAEEPGKEGPDLAGRRRRVLYAGAKPQSIPNFVNSVTQIMSEYGFDGIDIDIESPSLVSRSGRHRFPASEDSIGGEPYRRNSSIAPALRARFHADSGAGRNADTSRISWLRRAVRNLPSLAMGRARHTVVCDVQDYNTPPLQGLDARFINSVP